MGKLNFSCSNTSKTIDVWCKNIGNQRWV